MLAAVRHCCTQAKGMATMQGAITCWAVANVDKHPKTDSSASARAGLPMLHLLSNYNLLQANITVTQAPGLQPYVAKVLYHGNCLPGRELWCGRPQLAKELCTARPSCTAGAGCQPVLQPGA
jgi:hypothetical protein